VIPFTFHALVPGFQVRLEVLGTRLVPSELRIRYPDLAPTSSRTAGVRQFQHVGDASEVAVVELDAPADFHATVQRACHDDDLVKSARRVERLRFAIGRIAVAGVCQSQQHIIIIHSSATFSLRTPDRRANSACGELVRESPSLNPTNNVCGIKKAEPSWWRRRRHQLGSART
jgi:hypothetical protein